MGKGPEGSEGVRRPRVPADPGNRHERPLRRTAEGRRDLGIRISRTQRRGGKRPAFPTAPRASRSPNEKNRGPCIFVLTAPAENSTSPVLAKRHLAQVAELVDAQVSGTCGRKVVEVRVFSWAPTLLRILAPRRAVPAPPRGPAQPAAHPDTPERAEYGSITWGAGQQAGNHGRYSQDPLPHR